MDKNAAISLIGELSNACGPSGFEDDAVEVLKKHCAPLGRIEEDSLRNLYVYRNENTGDKPVLILVDGVSRIDNRKYKDRFGCKAKMIPAELVEPLIGHDIGGVCPFGINEGVKVYLDISLKKHEVVYPAVGSDHSGVRLTIPELEKCSGFLEWVDVCKQPE